MAIILGLIVLAAALFVIPLGLPGIWIMVAVGVAGAFGGEVGTFALVVSLALAGAAEVAEFLLVKQLSIRYGGSNRAFWGAIGGGVIGMLVGFPIAVIGPLIAGVLGTFAGAVAVTLWEGKHLRLAGRVGWGAIVGRAAAAAIKISAGIAILLILGSSLVLP